MRYSSDEQSPYYSYHVHSDIVSIKRNGLVCDKFYVEIDDTEGWGLALSQTTDDPPTKIYGDFEVIFENNSLKDSHADITKQKRE